jgi:hypothetical protein
MSIFSSVIVRSTIEHPGSQLISFSLALRVHGGYRTGSAFRNISLVHKSARHSVYILFRAFTGHLHPWRIATVSFWQRIMIMIISFAISGPQGARLIPQAAEFWAHFYLVGSSLHISGLLYTQHNTNHAAQISLYSSDSISLAAEYNVVEVV